MFAFESPGCDNVTRQTVVNSSPRSQSRKGCWDGVNQRKGLRVPSAISSASILSAEQEITLAVA